MSARSRFLKRIDDARKYASIIKTGKGEAPNRKKVSLIMIAATYSDALILMTLDRLETELRKEDIETKEAVSILDALKRYSDWAMMRQGWTPPAKKKGRPPIKTEDRETERFGEDLDAAMGLQNGERDGN